MSPNLPDPYHTLGLLHEAVGDVKKASATWALRCCAVLPQECGQHEAGRQAAQLTIIG